MENRWKLHQTGNHADTHLLQLLERRRAYAALLKVGRRRGTHILDDFGVDVALSITVSAPYSSSQLACFLLLWMPPSVAARTYHKLVRHDATIAVR